MSAPMTIRTSTRISADPSSARRPESPVGRQVIVVTGWMHDTASLAPTLT